MRAAAFLLALLAFALPPVAFAQSGPARHSVYVELLGNTAVASLNVDTVGDDGFGFRIGGFIDPTPLFGCSDRNLACQRRDRQREREQPFVGYFVVMGHRLVGTGEHRLELGAGVLVGHANPGVLDFLPRAALTATLGYRLQPHVGRPGIRVGLAPIVSADRVLLRPGFSVSWGLPTPR